MKSLNNGHAEFAEDQKSAVEMERELARALLENTADFIYLKELDSTFRCCSKAVADRFGIHRSEVIGKTDFDFFDVSHAQPAYEDEQEIVRTGEPIIGKVELETMQDGKQFWGLTTKLPFRNKDGQIIGTFGITKDITAFKEAEAKLQEMTKQLVESSRAAGMAEVATSVLHNVGNVLNSVNVSVTVATDKVRGSKASSLQKVVSLLQDHLDDLPAFFAKDKKGQQLPAYLASLADRLAEEQKALLAELQLLRSNVDHVNEIIAMQQAYAKVAGVNEVLSMQDLVEDALRLNAGAVERHNLRVVREFEPAPLVTVDRHKVLQILVNLIRNAKYALDERGHVDKVLTFKIAPVGTDRVRLCVVDNGIGISPENLTRIFEHGFTTRKNGHGFGLHSGALAANELGGKLSVHSDGPNLGATFCLELPAQPQDKT